jgi:hypothetical protein
MGRAWRCAGAWPGGAGDREGELDATAELLDAHLDLHERARDALERGTVPASALGHRAMHRVRQPVGAQFGGDVELVDLSQTTSASCASRP